MTLSDKIAEVQSVARRIAKTPRDKISPVLKDEIENLYSMAVRVKDAASKVTKGTSTMAPN